MERWLSWQSIRHTNQILDSIPPAPTLKKKKNKPTKQKEEEPEIPEQGRWEPEDLGNLLTSQEASGSTRDPVLKRKEGHHLRKTPDIVFTSTHTYAWVHIEAQAYKKDK